jgi:hypothetical protein
MFLIVCPPPHTFLIHPLLTFSALPSSFSPRRKDFSPSSSDLPPSSCYHPVLRRQRPAGVRMVTSQTTSVFEFVSFLHARIHYLFYRVRIIVNRVARDDPTKLTMHVRRICSSMCNRRRCHCRFERRGLTFPLLLSCRTVKRLPRSFSGRRCATLTSGQCALLLLFDLSSHVR